MNNSDDFIRFTVHSQTGGTVEYTYYPEEKRYYKSGKWNEPFVNRGIDVSQFMQNILGNIDRTEIISQTIDEAANTFPQHRRALAAKIRVNLHQGLTYDAIAKKHKVGKKFISEVAKAYNLQKRSRKTK